MRSAGTRESHRVSRSTVCTLSLPPQRSPWTVGTRAKGLSVPETTGSDIRAWFVLDRHARDEVQLANWAQRGYQQTEYDNMQSHGLCGCGRSLKRPHCAVWPAWRHWAQAGPPPRRQGGTLVPHHASQNSMQFKMDRLVISGNFYFANFVWLLTTGNWTHRYGGPP